MQRNRHRDRSIGRRQRTGTKVRTFVMNERKHCVSEREWKFRLKGYGYDLRQSPRGTVLTTLPHGVEVCVLD